MKTKVSKSITLDPECWDYLQDIAFINERSVSYLINTLIKKEIEYDTAMNAEAEKHG